MEKNMTLKERIRALAEKYALENLGLDENTYRKILNEGIQKTQPLTIDNHWVNKIFHERV